MLVIQFYKYKIQWYYVFIVPHSILFVKHFFIVYINEQNLTKLFQWSTIKKQPILYPSISCTSINLMKFRKEVIKMVEFFAFLQQVILVAEFVKDLIQAIGIMTDIVVEILWWLSNL